MKKYTSSIQAKLYFANPRSGFTLIELMIVVAIIGILAAILIPSLETYVDKAKMSNDTAYAASLSNMLSYYEAEGNDISKLQASDVRNILKEQSEKELNFDANMDGVGFFYDSKTKKVVALKYGDTFRVNAIAPGFFITDQNRTLLTNPDGTYTDRAKSILAHTPFKRFGEPDEILGALHYLASDASKFVTGSLLTIDGGFDSFSI